MGAINSQGLTSSGLSKNCWKCGGEFCDYSGTGLAKMCQPCRKPKKPYRLPGNLSGKALSVRETQLVTLIAKGMAYKEIATELHLCEGTIKIYVRSVGLKTGHHGKTKIAIWWLTKGDK